jgi:hypothetical protein
MKEQYNNGIGSLKETHRNAYMYVHTFFPSIPALWVTHFVTGRRCGHTTSNVVEAINALLREDRFLSCIDLLDAIHNRYMAMRFEWKLDAIRKLAIPGQRYTDFAPPQLAESIGLVQHRNV